MPPDQQEVLKSYQRDMVRRLGETLQAVAPCAFDGNAARLRATTMSVFGMLNWFYMWNPAANAAVREDYARLVTELTLKGVKGLEA